MEPPQCVGNPLISRSIATEVVGPALDAASYVSNCQRVRFKKTALVFMQDIFRLHGYAKNIHFRDNKATKVMPHHKRQNQLKNFIPLISRSPGVPSGIDPDNTASC